MCKCCKRTFFTVNVSGQCPLATGNIKILGWKLFYTELLLFPKNRTDWVLVTVYSIFSVFHIIFITVWPHNESCMCLSVLVFCCIVIFMCMFGLHQSWGTCLCSDTFPAPHKCFVYAALPAYTSLSMQSDAPVDCFDGIVVFFAFFFSLLSFLSPFLYMKSTENQ